MVGLLQIYIYIICIEGPFKWLILAEITETKPDLKPFLKSIVFSFMLKKENKYIPTDIDGYIK